MPDEIFYSLTQAFLYIDKLVYHTPVFQSVIYEPSHISGEALCNNRQQQYPDAFCHKELHFNYCIGLVLNTKRYQGPPSTNECNLGKT